MATSPRVGKVDPTIAALMTTMLPGLGQLMRGRPMPGVLWAFFVGFGYLAFLWAGIALHVLCILDAGLANREGDLPLSKNPAWWGALALVVALAAYLLYRNL